MELSVYTADAYTQVLCQLIEQEEPDIILMGHTAVCRDTAPRVAARLGLGLISDSVSVGMEGETIVFTRPIYSGKAFQKKSFRQGRVFATLRPNNFAILEKPVQVEVARLEPIIKDLRAVVKETVRKGSWRRRFERGENHRLWRTCWEVRLAVEL